MKYLLVVFLCLGSVLADESPGYYAGPHSATTVCIEIRPSPHANPTKVCGPVVHGPQFPQRPQQPQQKGAEPPIYSGGTPIAQGQAVAETDESREAEAPCASGLRPPATYQGRQPQPQPQAYVPRMEPVQEQQMMPLMPMEFDGSGWRQAGAPCAANQRGPAPMPYPPPMMPPHMQGRQPMPIPNPRSWFVNPQQQAMMQRAVEEQAKQTATQQKSAEDPSAPKKETLETLLKECEEKTKLLQEKEAKITELKSQIVNSKKDTEHHDQVATNNEAKH